MLIDHLKHFTITNKGRKRKHMAWEEKRKR
jgi:hypothetical protein